MRAAYYGATALTGAGQSDVPQVAMVIVQLTVTVLVAGFPASSLVVSGGVAQDAYLAGTD